MDFIKGHKAPHRNKRVCKAPSTHNAPTQRTPLQHKAPKCCENMNFHIINDIDGKCETNKKSITLNCNILHKSIINVGISPITSLQIENLAATA